MKKVLSLVISLVVFSTLLFTSCSSDSGKIRIATDATWAPFEYVNSDTNVIEGVDIDIMNAIAEAAGLDIEFVNVGWDALLAGMAQGTYDVAISSITITEDRKKDMLFSDPYFAAGQIVIVGINNTTITGKDTLTGTVAAQLGTTGAIEVAKLSGVTLRNYDEIGLAFQDLMNGQVNAVVCDNPVALLYVGENPTKLKIAGEPFTDEWYGIAVSKGNEDILEKINEGLAEIIAAGKIDEIADKWNLGE
jgi:polar amino acid transport system substrate-binding protein